MKTATLSIEGLNLDRLLQEADVQDVVFLRTNGEVKFALMHADEGDQEVYALKSNPEFMAYLTECHQRADSEPRFSLGGTSGNVRSAAFNFRRTEQLEILLNFLPCRCVELDQPAWLFLFSSAADCS